MTTPRYRPESLEVLARELFSAAGMDEEKAACVANVLVTADKMGARTHGIALCPKYIDEIEKGLMDTRGVPEVIRDHGATLVWDGNYLPGPWLVDRAIASGSERVGEFGVVTTVIRRSHHIACLSALVKRATERGLVAILASSDPAFGFIAPFGGKEGLLTPNPIAVGYPGEVPVWIDVSTSITTVGMARQKAAADTLFEHPWMMDGYGSPTNDPRVLDATPAGTLLPLGGREYGHKGFGLALMIEMLTQGLAGFGRQDVEKRWGANVFLQLLDPDAFTGRDAFARQMDFLTASCHANAPIDPLQPVRMPGEGAQARMKAAEEIGLELPPATAEALRAKALRAGVRLPDPI